VSDRWRILAHETPSLSEIFGGTTAHLPRVYFDVEIGLGLDVLDLVDPWLQFSIIEDGGVVGRV